MKLRFDDGAVAELRTQLRGDLRRAEGDVIDSAKFKIVLLNAQSDGVISADEYAFALSQFAPDGNLDASKLSFQDKRAILEEHALYGKLMDDGAAALHSQVAAALGLDDVGAALQAGIGAAQAYQARLDARPDTVRRANEVQAKIEELEAKPGASKKELRALRFELTSLERKMDEGK